MSASVDVCLWFLSKTTGCVRWFRLVKRAVQLSRVIAGTSGSPCYLLEISTWFTFKCHERTASCANNVYRIFFHVNSFQKFVSHVSYRLCISLLFVINEFLCKSARTVKIGEQRGIYEQFSYENSYLYMKFGNIAAVLGMILYLGLIQDLEGDKFLHKTV